jgi:hypothetical protein
MKMKLKMGELEVEIEYSKPAGFFRAKDGAFTLTVDGKPQTGSMVDLKGKKGLVRIKGIFK